MVMIEQILSQPIYMVFGNGRVQFMTNKDEANKIVEDGKLNDALNDRIPSNWWVKTITDEKIERN